MPRIIKEVRPEYSRAAMRAKVQGAVELETLIAVDGTVTDVRVIRPLHADLDAAAIRSVKAWKFTTPTVHGVPTPMAVMIELTFTLR